MFLENWKPVFEKAIAEASDSPDDDKRAAMERAVIKLGTIKTGVKRALMEFKNL